MFEELIAGVPSLFSTLTQGGDGPAAPAPTDMSSATSGIYGPTTQTGGTLNVNKVSTETMMIVGLIAVICIVVYKKVR